MKVATYPERSSIVHINDLTGNARHAEKGDRCEKWKTM